jgi:hypothetical protein
MGAGRKFNAAFSAAPRNHPCLLASRGSRSRFGSRNGGTVQLSSWVRVYPQGGLFIAIAHICGSKVI